METVQESVERLCNEIRAIAPHHTVERLTDQISVLTKANLMPCVDDRWSDLRFTPSQTRIMAFLASGMGKTKQYDAIMNAVYFDKPDVASPEIIKIFVSQIRKKLEGSAYELETVRGQGYRLKSLAENIAAA